MPPEPLIYVDNVLRERPRITVAPTPAKPRPRAANLAVHVGSGRARICVQALFAPGLRPVKKLPKTRAFLPTL